MKLTIAALTALLLATAAPVLASDDDGARGRNYAAASERDGDHDRKEHAGRLDRDHDDDRDSDRASDDGRGKGARDRENDRD